TRSLRVLRVLSGLFYPQISQIITEFFICFLLREGFYQVGKESTEGRNDRQEASAPANVFLRVLSVCFIRRFYRLSQVFY
ncbi:MAG: hypothetical protein NE328_10910, partial [Lentisphaeraceae bacterium]|nr:hypothetical protein [Lentisphaeraceae bacterium]